MVSAPAVKPAGSKMISARHAACGVIERRLKLKVNREKSSIPHASQATLA